MRMNLKEFTKENMELLFKKRKSFNIPLSKAGSFIGVSAMDYNDIEHGKREITPEQYLLLLKGIEEIESEMTMQRRVIY